MYFSQANDNRKLMKLLISYTNSKQEHSENSKEIECFKWIRNLSMLQNISTKRYYTPIIAYDTFNEVSSSFDVSS